MSHTFEQQLAACRKAIPKARSKDLLHLFEQTHWCLAQRALTAGMGIHDDDPQIEQQYRLTAYALEQELLRRLR